MITFASFELNISQQHPGTLSHSVQVSTLASRLWASLCHQANFSWKNAAETWPWFARYQLCTRHLIPADVGHGEWSGWEANGSVTWRLDDPKEWNHLMASMGNTTFNKKRTSTSRAREISLWSAFFSRGETTTRPDPGSTASSNWLS